MNRIHGENELKFQTLLIKARYVTYRNGCWYFNNPWQSGSLPSFTFLSNWQTLGWESANQNQNLTWKYSFSNDSPHRSAAIISKLRLLVEVNLLLHLISDTGVFVHIFVGFTQRRDKEPWHFRNGTQCNISWLLWFANCCHEELCSSCCRVSGSVLGHVYILFVFHLLVLGDFCFISSKFNIYLPSWRKFHSLSKCILPALMMTSFIQPLVMHFLWIIIVFTLFYPTTITYLACNGI